MVRLEGTEYEAADVNILVNPDFYKEAPEIINFLKKYSTTVDQNNKFLAAKEENDLTLEEAAVWFLKNNTDVWTKWLDAKTAEKVKKALK
jgi:glycine betaine/proline transport system substrate-binding protein